MTQYIAAYDTHLDQKLETNNKNKNKKHHNVTKTTGKTQTQINTRHTKYTSETWIVCYFTSESGDRSVTCLLCYNGGYACRLSDRCDRSLFLTGHNRAGLAGRRGRWCTRRGAGFLSYCSWSASTAAPTAAARSRFAPLSGASTCLKKNYLHNCLGFTWYSL